NRVHVHLAAASGCDWDLHGTRGKIRTVNDIAVCRMWRAGGRWNELEEAPFAACESASAPVLIVRDLIRSLETDAQTRNGVRLARRSQEIMTAMVESHRQGGARVPLPL